MLNRRDDSALKPTALLRNVPEINHHEGHAGNLEKLRHEAVECKLISDLATDKSKRELFAKLAEHHRTLAAEVERAIAETPNDGA